MTFAVMLRAGLKGVEEKIPCPEPVERNIFRLSEQEMRELGIRSLPGSLGAAIRSAEKSQFLRKALGEHVYHALLRVKRAEWDAYRTYVSP